MERVASVEPVVLSTDVDIAQERQFYDIGGVVLAGRKIAEKLMIAPQEATLCVLAYHMMPYFYPGIDGPSQEAFLIYGLNRLVKERSRSLMETGMAIGYITERDHGTAVTSKMYMLSHAIFEVSRGELIAGLPVYLTMTIGRPTEEVTKFVPKSLLPNKLFLKMLTNPNERCLEVILYNLKNNHIGSSDEIRLQYAQAIALHHAFKLLMMGELNDSQKASLKFMLRQILDVDLQGLDDLAQPGPVPLAATDQRERNIRERAAEVEAFQSLWYGMPLGELVMILGGVKVDSQLVRLMPDSFISFTDFCGILLGIDKSAARKVFFRKKVAEFIKANNIPTYRIQQGRVIPRAVIPAALEIYNQSL